MMDEFGLYYSTYNEEPLKPAMRTIHKGGYAHYGNTHNLFEVLGYIKEDETKWVFMQSIERYFILPKDMITWKDQ